MDPDPQVEGFLALLAARRAPRTVEAYRRDLASRATWLDRAPHTVTTEELERYLAELRAQGLSAATIARRSAAVRSFFRHLVLLGARTDNPAAELDCPAAPRSCRARSRRGEAERLIEAATGTAPRELRDRALVELLYGAGLRVSEAVGLETGGVDLDERLVRCIGKGGKERIVPIGRAGGRGAPPLPRARPALPRPPPPAGAVPERPGRPADPRRRLPDPAPARGEGRARAGARPPAPAPALVRDAPARGRRRPAQRPGDARPRRPGHDRALHPRLRPAPPRVVLPGPSARAPNGGVSDATAPGTRRRR